MEFGKPQIGISGCLVGQKVRYNGDSKRRNDRIDALSDHVTLSAFCPEMAIGMGVPRQTVRLVGELGNTRLMDSATQQLDYTDPMQAYAAQVVSSNPNLAGYILVRGSPSCGYERVKRYNENGNVVLNDSVGIFAAALHAIDPLLPLEEDGRLHDPALRENFVTRVFAYHSWKQLCASPMTHGRLMAFWSDFKYLLMSHHAPSYKAIGPLLANASGKRLDVVAQRFIELLMSGLAVVATRKTHTNVLQHIRGYLKKTLDRPEREEMDALITQYRTGAVPLVVPMTLLRHHFRRHRSDYIARQVYLMPYPEQLGLRNTI